MKSKTRKTVIIHTDGSCHGNPGKGGYAAILQYKTSEKIIQGVSVDTTTSQRMELTAVVEALKTLNQPCNVVLNSDSQLVVKGIREWMPNWKANNWVKPDGKQPAHLDLWQELDKLISVHNVKVVKVRAHSTNNLNNRVDELATAAIP